LRATVNVYVSLFVREHKTWIADNSVILCDSNLRFVLYEEENSLLKHMVVEKYFNKDAAS